MVESTNRRNSAGLVQGTLEQIIDHVYDTALDYKSGFVLSAVVAMSDENGFTSHANSKLNEHVDRARRIVARGAARNYLPHIVLDSMVEGTVSIANAPICEASQIESILAPNGDLTLKPSSWKAVEKWCSGQLSNEVMLRFLFEKIDSDEKIPALVSKSKRINGPEKLSIIFLPSISEDDDSLIEALKETMRLSHRQAQIAILTASGLSAEKIAQRLEISANTVRQHIKNVYLRLGLRKQTELASSVGQLKLVTPLSETVAQNSFDSRSVFRFEAGAICYEEKSQRKICYGDYGAPNGVPCAMFHSSFGGRWLTEKAAGEFARAGLRLIIPERPGLGLTDASEGSRRNQSIADMISVLDSLKIDQCIGLGFSGGCFYLTDAIAAHPARFSLAGLISPRAFKIPEIASDGVLSPLESLFGLPGNITALIHEAIEGIDPVNGWPEVIKMLLDNNPVDIRELEDKALLDMHVIQARNNLLQGATGVAEEWLENGCDMQAPRVIENFDYRMCYGGSDEILTILQGVIDWAACLTVRPEVVVGAGHLVFLSDTAKVIDALGLRQT